MSVQKQPSAKKATSKKAATKPAAKPAKKPSAKASPAKGTAQRAASARPLEKKAAPKKAAPKAAPKAASKAAPKATAAKKPAKARASRPEPIAPTAGAREEHPGQRLALAIADAALDKKAVDVLIVDVRGKVDYTDFIVVMSGTSDRHVAALARGIEEGVLERTGERCAGVEGLPEGAWVLMDFSDVVVHVFHTDVRSYYDLESLFLDASRVPVPGQAPAATRER